MCRQTTENSHKNCPEITQNRVHTPKTTIPCAIASETTPATFSSLKIRAQEKYSATLNHLAEYSAKLPRKTRKEGQKIRQRKTDEFITKSAATHVSRLAPSKVSARAQKWSSRKAFRGRHFWGQFVTKRHPRPIPFPPEWLSSNISKNAKEIAAINKIRRSRNRRSRGEKAPQFSRSDYLPNREGVFYEECFERYANWRKMKALRVGQFRLPGPAKCLSRAFSRLLVTGARAGRELPIKITNTAVCCISSAVWACSKLFPRRALTGNFAFEHCPYDSFFIRKNEE